MGAMSNLDVVAQEHGILTSDPGALVQALAVIQRQDALIVSLVTAAETFTGALAGFLDAVKAAQL